MILETGNVIKLTYEKKGVELTFGQRALSLTVGYGVSVIGGDVYGGSSSTDNAIARYNGTTGKTIQNSLATIDDNGSVNIPTGQKYKINGTALAYGDITNAIALTSLSSSATGLTYTNTTGAFSLTSGYVIPTTTEESNWNTAYGWGNHASAGYLTSTTGVLKSLFDANTILYATADDTPLALTVGEQTLVGRLTGGNISAVSLGIADNNILQVDDATVADNDYAKFTANGIEGVPYSTVLSDIGAQASNANLTSVSGLTYASTSFVKMTGANTFALDTNTYLTSLTGAVLTDQTVGQTIGDTTNRLTKLWATDAEFTNSPTIGGVAISTTYAPLISPSFTTPTLGVAVGTSLALGGATLGANALAITGDMAISGTLASTGLMTLQKADSGAQTDLLINPAAKTSGYFIEATINGTTKFNLSYTGAMLVSRTGMSALISAGLELRSNSVASAGTPVQNSPSHLLTSRAWNTTSSASKLNSIDILLKPTSGATTGGNFIIQNNTLDGTANTDVLLNLDMTTKNLAITSINGLTPTALSTGFSIAGGTTSKTLTVDADLSTSAVLSNPMTTAGDIIVGGASGVPTRLAKGDDAKVLTMVGGAVAWATAGGGGASVALDNLSSVAINTTLVSDTDNTDALGTTAIAWSDLFLGNGAVITFNSAPSTPDITLTHSANTLTFDGGTLALGANNLTMTGSIADTTNRVTKGWFTDIESTNMPTVGGTAILSSLTAPQFTTIELGHASDTTLSRSAAGVLAVEGKNVLVNDAGVVNIAGSSTTAGTLKIYEDTDEGTNSVSIKVPALAGDYTLTLPTTDGAANEFLQTDGSGNLTWAASSGGTTILKAVKTADETVNNSSTYQDDDHLSVTVEASSTYIVDVFLYTEGAASTGSAIKAQLVMPTDAVATGIRHANSSSTTAFISTASTGTTTCAIANNCNYAGVGLINYRGVIVVSTTAGTVKVQWAQQSAEEIDRILKTGSYMTLTKI